MDYKYIKLKNYDLYLIKTDQFKTIDVKCFFYKEINKREVTMRNCLIDLLLYASQNYPSKKALSLRANDLYSLFLSSSNTRFGHYLITKLAISFLNPKYTEEGMMEKSFAFLNEVLFHPLAEDNHFHKDFLEYIKKELYAESATIKENPRVYSDIRLLSLIGPNEPYAINGYCDKEILDEIDEYNLYEFYQQFLNDNRLFITVTGNFNEEEVLQYIEKYLPFQTNGKLDNPLIINHQKIRKRAQTVIEDTNFYQSKLALALKSSDLTEFEYNYVINMYNGILGGGSDNMLMRTVREKHSLAYYVNSSLCKADNLIVINSGIDAANFKKTVRLIKKTLQDIKEGRFKEEDLVKCQTEYITTLTEATETIDGLNELLLGRILFNTAPLEERCEQILKVTKEDIIKFSQKLQLDTIYLLKGV